MAVVNAYCTAEDIVAKLPFLLRNAKSEKALIPDENINEVCDEISAEMDSRFSAVGINTPVGVIDNERLRRNIRRISVNGVCASILKSTPSQERYASLQASYEEQYYRDIAKIERDGLDTEDSDMAGAPTFGPDKYISAFDNLRSNPLNTQWGRW